MKQHLITHCKRSYSILQNKFSLRKEFRDIRDNIPEAEREQAAVSAVKLLIENTQFIESRHVACYSSFKSEFQTQLIIDAIWNAGKICYLPVLVDAISLKFIRYQKNDELQLNQLSIPEPVDLQHTIEPEHLDIVIAPLVAFDRMGTRLGTGGGFYDRSFAFMQEATGKKPYMMGLGFHVQQAKHIDAEEWDVKLDCVLTEKEIIAC